MGSKTLSQLKNLSEDNKLTEEILNERTQMMTPSCGHVDIAQKCFHLL